MNEYCCMNTTIGLSIRRVSIETSNTLAIATIPGCAVGNPAIANPCGQTNPLTSKRNCAMILDVEGYTRIVPSGAKLPIRVCYSVTLDKLPNGTGGEFCFSGLDGLASVDSTTPVLTQQRIGGA